MSDSTSSGDLGVRRILKGWNSLKSAGPRRLVVTSLLLLLAFFVAQFSWSIPIVSDAERSLYDLRTVLLAPRVEQDQRVVLAVYDDQTLIAARKRSPLDRGLLAKALQNLDGMGAKAIGIDILFDQPQDEDDALILALREMKTPVSVAFADIATNEADIIFDQQEFLRRFLDRLQGSKAHPASIRLDYSHGVTRTWPEPSPDLPPVLARSMLADGGDAALTQPGFDGSVRYRLPAEIGRPVYPSLRIDLFADPEIAPLLTEQVRGRYVLIGGSLVDVDRVATPMTSVTGETVPGIEVHAAMLTQLLDRATFVAPAPWSRWLQTILILLAAVLSGLHETRSWKVVPIVAGQVLMFAGLPFYLQSNGADTFAYPSFGPILGWAIAFVAVVSAARAAGAVERRFAHSALGKYLPKEMAQTIIENPKLLALHGEKKEIFVIFSDLEGFTKLSHSLQPETVARLLNTYLEMLSQVVLDHGGVIDKFVGDAVVAFWGAPIARPDDGERAAMAGYAMWQAGERFREEADPALPPIGKTRVGMHWGEAVVGNFGGKDRIQYTALGDSMNTAARLESANKALDTSVLASRELVERSNMDWWRPLGRVVLRGRSKPVDVFEPVPDWPKADRDELAEALGLARVDPDRATEMIVRLQSNNVSDTGLENLLRRIRQLNEEGAYVLQ